MIKIFTFIVTLAAFSQGLFAGASTGSVYIAINTTINLPEGTDHLYTAILKDTLNPVIGLKAEIFPNPTSDGNFTVTTSVPVKHLEVINMLGQIVLKKENPSGDLSLNVELPNQENGLYFVKMTFPDHKSLTEKLLSRNSL